MSQEFSRHPLLNSARSLGAQVESCGDQIDSTGSLPEHLVSALVHAGLFKMTVPLWLGGSEAPLPLLIEVIEEIARVDASVAWCLAQNAGVAAAAGSMSRQGAQEIVGAADVRMAGGYGSARAVRVPGGYRLTGEWRFCSGIRHATWLRGNTALVEDEAAEPSSDPSVDEIAPGRAMLFFARAQAEVLDVWQVSGLRG